MLISLCIDSEFVSVHLQSQIRGSTKALPSQTSHRRGTSAAAAGGAIGRRKGMSDIDRCCGKRRCVTVMQDGAVILHCRWCAARIRPAKTPSTRCTYAWQSLEAHDGPTTLSRKRISTAVVQGNVRCPLICTSDRSALGGGRLEAIANQALPEGDLGGRLAHNWSARRVERARARCPHV